MQFLLHIGHGKTGTTSFQSTCWTNPKRLRKQGILYPKSVQGVAHHQLALVGDPRPPESRTFGWVKPQSETELFEMLDAEIREDQPRVVILSSEILFHVRHPAAVLDFLRRWTDDVSVVAILRRQDSYLEATYAQRLKTGGTRVDTDEFIENMTERRWMDFELHLRRWWDVVNEGALHVATLDPGGPPVDVNTFLFDQVGGVPELRYVPRKNERLSRDAIELLRSMPKERRVGLPYRPLMKALIDWSQENPDPPGWQYQFDYAQRLDFLDQHRASNAAVAERLTYNVPELFSGGPDASEHTPYPGLTVDRAAELARYIWGSAAGVEAPI
jgi:hypothetical protein